MICSHLRDSIGLGFVRVEVPPGQDDYETLMCESCDALVREEDGWTDRVFDAAGWKLYCRECASRVLERHRLVFVGRLGAE